jgi:CBS domain-containing protein
MKASDVMGRHVVTVERGAPIAKAARLMLQNRISGVPVVGGSGKLVGIATEGDLLHRAERRTERSHARKVEEVMTPDVTTVTEDTPLDEIVRVMERRRIKRVPVVREGTVVGIVSRADLLRALAGDLAEFPPAAIDDTMLRKRVLAEIKKQNRAPPDGVKISVRKGMVEFWGSIHSEYERMALRVATENVPGVKGVQDHLRWSGWAIEVPQGEVARET